MVWDLGRSIYQNEKRQNDNTSSGLSRGRLVPSYHKGN